MIESDAVRAYFHRLEIEAKWRAVVKTIVVKRLMDDGPSL